MIEIRVELERSSISIMFVSKLTKWYHLPVGEYSIILLSFVHTSPDRYARGGAELS
jgi:hypothetical protein